MSSWVYITGVLELDTNLEMDNLEEYIKNQLKNAPKITGSERDAEIFINILNGYNSSKVDCESCKYFHTKEYLENNITTCETDDNFDCESKRKEYQTKILISISGNLRDKKLEKTKKEYEKFEKYITKTLGYSIENKSIEIKY